MQYQTLIKTLDKICAEAPSDLIVYKPDKEDLTKLNQARSKAFIHLYLKVKCGMTDFSNRQDYITDGPQDGGVDAYYIDKENKKIFFIQSKLGATKNNFEQKKITANDLVTMEIKRIKDGERKDSRGNSFSKKIIKLQKEWSKISDQAYYDYIVIILGNLQNYSEEQIKRIIDNSKFEIFDFDRTYKELLFPLCSGVYHDPKEIRIAIDLAHKEQSTLKQKISTNLGTFPIKIVFVPTKEIGRIMSKYKNSILKYNPRNYLSLSHNPVNRKIRESIVDNSKNDFAIYNNGITMIANSFEQTESTGTKNLGQVIMINPQIINGGQTAYVLSEIYEEQPKNDFSVFKGKEVMLKVIVLTQKKERNIDFIEQISNATNQQTKVKEADRRSNDKIQLLIEGKIFDTFGYFYERKAGEFFNGVKEEYIDKNLIIDRFDLLKSYLAWQGDASNARRSGSEVMFGEDRFKEIMKKTENFRDMFFSYKLLKNIKTLERRSSKNGFGASIKYGKMGIISAIGALDIDTEAVMVEEVDNVAQQEIKKVESRWDKFILFATKNKANKSYIINKHLDLDVYFKGSTVNGDIQNFFKKIK